MEILVDRLSKYMECSGLSANKLTVDAGLSVGLIGKAMNNRTGINSDSIEKILRAFPDLNPTWLLTGKGEMTLTEKDSEPVAVYKSRADVIVGDVQQIPLYNVEAAAGIVQLFRNQHDDKPIDFIQIPGIPKSDGAIYITGDSMYPLLKSGDIVIYKQMKDLKNVTFLWGEMYIVGFDNDGDNYVGVKFLQKSDQGEDYIRLVSHNQHHSPFDVHKKKIKALALVKASIRINSMS